MLPIESIKELRCKIIDKRDENYTDFFISWGFQVNQYDFTVEADSTGHLMANDENENEEEIAIISMNLLKELMEKHLIYFNDVSWNDNETYLYGIRENNL
jgi:hypothetical protein